jgi:hypothetical protein
MADGVLKAARPDRCLHGDLDDRRDLHERRDPRGRGRAGDELDHTNEPTELVAEQVARRELPSDRELDQAEVVPVPVVQADRAELHARSVTARRLGVESAGAAMTEADYGSPGGRSPRSDPRPRLEGRARTPSLATRSTRASSEWCSGRPSY